MDRPTKPSGRHAVRLRWDEIITRLSYRFNFLAIREFHNLFLQQPQGPPCTSLGRFGTSQGNQFGFLLAVKNPRNRRRRSLLAAQYRLEAFLHQLLAHPVNHGCAGLQRLDDPAITPPFTGLRDIGLQQYPRLQQALCRALSFPQQRFESLAFLATQPHNIFLYRNLLRSHDRLRRRVATKANHRIKIPSTWLKRATSRLSRCPLAKGAGTAGQPHRECPPPHV